MKSHPRRICFYAALLSMSALSMNATPTYTPRPTPVTSNLLKPGASETDAVLVSLKKDVLSHPDDFITFKSQAAAMKFIVDHGDEVHLETEHEAVMRGILGYWDGRTLVVVPATDPQ